MILTKLFKKTLLTMILLFGLISLVISAFAAWTLNNQLKNDYLNNAIAISNSITSSSLELFIEQDATTIQSLIDQFLKFEGVSYVFVTAESGSIVAHTFVPNFPPPLQDFIDTTLPIPGHHSAPVIQNFRLERYGDVINVTTPILAGSAGYLNMGMDLGKVRSIIWAAVFKIQMITLAIFLLSAVAAYFLINRLSRPLTELAAYSQYLAHHKFDAPMNIHSKDEIGDLAQTMHSMAQEISQLVSGLEDEVSKATYEFQEALAYLTVVLDNLADGLLVTASDGRIILYNPRLESMLGLEDHDLTGRWSEEVIGHDLAQIMIGPSRPDQPVRGGVKRLELEFTREDQSSFPGELSVSSVKIKGKTSYIGIIRDITDRKKAETELQKIHEDLERRVLLRTEELSMTNLMLKRQIVKKQQAEDALAAEKELLAVTLRSIGDGVIATDTNGKIILMNTVAEELTGWTQEDARNSDLNEVFRVVNEKTRNPLPYPELKTLGQGRTIEFKEDTLLLTRDGREVEIGDSLAPIYDKNNEIIGSVLVFRDISDQKQQEMERLRSEKLESLGVLAGGIAHDFNNILTAILNNVILARITGPESGPIMSKLKEAEQATLRAKQLTQQLLTFSKGGVPVRESTSIGDLIVDSTTFSLRGSNVRCRFTIQEDVWPADVDYGQIVQVVDNLVINADQAMPEGGEIHIKVENREVGEESSLPLFPGRYIRITVSDEGVGISEDIVEQIFDPYFTTKDTGSGLGLATTYSIVKNHGGHVEVQSIAGKGTTFTLYLPAASTLPLKTLQEPEGPIQGQGRVLVMDDEPSVREILRDTLSFLGYETGFAADGKEALKRYEQAKEDGTPYDVVIMDLTIPGGMGGKDTIKELLRIDPEVRAIVSSGYSQDPVMAHYEEYGFKSVLMKPYTVDEVSRKLNAVLHPYPDTVQRTDSGLPDSEPS